MKIFFVKTVYRTAATGRPSAVDENFDPGFTLVEERIVMFLAKDGDDAIRQAEREARAHARATHENPYGQAVKTRFLKALSAYELYEPLEAPTEVFSDTEVVPAEVTDRSVVDQRMGHEESPSEVRRRVNILDREFCVPLGSQEQGRAARGRRSQSGASAPSAPRLGSKGTRKAR